MSADTTTIAAAGGNDDRPKQKGEGTQDSEVFRLGALVKRARRGDKGAGSRLKELGVSVEASPGSNFNTAVFVQEKLLAEIGKDDREFASGIRSTVMQMRSDLCRSDASEEERLLAQVIITDWLFLTHLTERYGLGSGAANAKEDEQWQKRISKAHQRLLRSVRTQAQVRKLLRGNTVQVNIADKQVVQNART